MAFSEGVRDDVYGTALDILGNMFPQLSPRFLQTGNLFLLTSIYHQNVMHALIQFLLLRVTACLKLWISYYKSHLKSATPYQRATKIVHIHL